MKTKNYIEFRVYLHHDEVQADSHLLSVAESLKDVLYTEIEEIDEDVKVKMFSGDVTYEVHIGEMK